MLQIQTVEPDCLALLKYLMGLEELEDFRLAGGTALSLRLGHRISIDLDLFTNKLFDPTELITFLEGHFNKRVKIIGSNRYGVFTTIDNVKVDFLYRYEKFINNEDRFDEIRLASVEDIGAMKIHAAVSRNAKKDYYDVYELLNVYKFADLIRFYSAMYPNHDVIFALKFMTDFSELENEEEPVSLKEVSWPEITNKISTEIKNYVQTLQQKKIDADNEKQRREKK